MGHKMQYESHDGIVDIDFTGQIRGGLSSFPPGEGRKYTLLTSILSTPPELKLVLNARVNDDSVELEVTPRLIKQS
jgi:hypothetical protein